MSNDKKRTDLGFLGEDFQYKLVHEFLNNKEFFEELSVIIDQNVFTEPSLKTIVGVMKDRLSKDGCVPNYEMVGIELRQLSHSERECDTYMAVLEKIRNIDTSGVNRIKELAIKFFRQQNIVRAANEILRIAGEGDITKYDACVSLLNDAMNKGVHNDMGESPFEHLEQTLSDDYREPIPTGIEAVDQVLEGGLAKGELGVIIGPSGFGKSQPLDSRILTPDGYKLMGDMKVGDYVIGSDGKAHVVSGVFPQGKRPIYRVEFSNGTSCECDIEHLWNVNSLYQRHGKKYVRGTYKSGHMKVYSPDNSFKTLTLREILEKGILRRNSRVYNFKVPKVSPVEFNERETALDPYLVGYYIGDGCFSRADITVGECDKSNAEASLKSILGDDLHIQYREKRKVCTFSVVGESRKILLEHFSKDIHSSDKYVPEEYLFNSIEKRIALLQGLMDSDGHANKNGSCEFSSKSKQLALDVQFLVRSLGGFASLTERDSSYYSSKYGKRIYCGKSYRVTISMCDDSLPLFRFERKKSRVKIREKYSDAIFITNAEYVGEKDAQCIMVDSDEHLYVTEDFIVTHNTSLTSAMASYASTYKCPQNLYQGYKVLQIVFEDRIKQIQRKHIGRISGVEAKDLSKKEYIDQVKDSIENFEDKEMMDRNLRIVKFASGEKTAKSIGRFINNLKNSGFSPDLVIVDYFECLAHEADKSTTNEYEKEGKTMRVFEAMVGELNIAMWIPSQGTKDSINLDIVTMDKIGGSVKKAQIAHIIMSIARTTDDLEHNNATIAILKNRAGQSGKIFQNVYFNNGTCVIDTSQSDTVDTMFEARKKQNEEQLALQKDIMKKLSEQKKDAQN